MREVRRVLIPLNQGLFLNKKKLTVNFQLLLS